MKELGRIRKEYIRGNAGTTNIAGKTRKNRLIWVRYIMRSNNDEVAKNIARRVVARKSEKG